jgi:hypothetical protein
LHAHIAFVDQEQICLLLLSTTGTPQVCLDVFARKSMLKTLSSLKAFYALQQCSASIQSQLKTSGALDHIKHSLVEGE